MHFERVSRDGGGRELGVRASRIRHVNAVHGGGHLNLREWVSAIELVPSVYFIRLSQANRQSAGDGRTGLLKRVSQVAAGTSARSSQPDSNDSLRVFAEGEQVEVLLKYGAKPGERSAKSSGKSMFWLLWWLIKDWIGRRTL